MADLTFKLFGHDVSASKALQGVGAQAAQTGRQVERSMQSASASTIGLGTAMGILAADAARATGSMLSLGVRTAASMEQAQIGFTTLLGSATEAQTYLEDLKTFAAQTPFEFAGLVDSSRLLLGVGVEAKQVIPILTALGDASGALAINQESFGRIMVAVSQTIAAGKIKLGDMNQLMNNGLPVWKLMSEAMGKPVPELQKLIEKGQLLSEDVLPKMFAQMQKDYGGAMAAQSKTLGGLWSTLKDTLSQGMADALQPLIPLIEEGLGKAIPMLADGAVWLADAFARAEPTIRSWGSAFGDLTSFVITHGETLLQLAVSIGVAISAYRAITLAQIAFNVAMSANPIGLIIVALSALAGAFVFVWQRSETFRKVALVGFLMVSEGAANMLHIVADLATALLRVIAMAVGVFDKDMAASLRAAAEKVQGYARTMDASIQAIRNKVVDVSIVTHYIEVRGISNGKAANIQRAAGSANDREGRSVSASDLAAVSSRKTTSSSGPIKLPSIGGLGGSAGGGGGGGSAKSSAASARATARKEAVADLAVFAAQLTKSRETAGKAFANLAGDVSKAGSSAARRIVETYAKTVLPLTQTYEILGTKLKAAQDNLKKLRDDAASYAAQVKTSIIDSAKIGDAKGYGGIVTQLQMAVAYAKQFGAVLTTLKTLGADQATIAQLVAAGPQQGLKLGAQLAAEGKAGVAEVANLQKQLATAAGGVGASASDAMYQAGIKAAEGLVKGLASQQSALAAQMSKLATAMITAIKKALGIKSPSTVFAEIGDYAGAGLIQGMQGQYGAVSDAARRLVGAIGDSSATVGAASSRSSGGVTVNLTVQGVVGDEATLVRTVQSAFRRVNGSGLAMAR